MGENPKAPGFWTMTVGNREASLKALEDAIRKQGGNPRDLLDLLRIDSEYAASVALAMVRNMLVCSSELMLAQSELGRNIFTDVDWISYYDVKLNLRQLHKALKFPWGEDILSSPCPFVKGKLVKDTHFAFFGISSLNGAPLTVAKWMELHLATDRPIDQPKFYFSSSGSWHQGQPHTDEATLSLRWYLLLKDIVPDSMNKTPEEQVKMLPVQYEVPTTIVEVTKDILVFRKTGPYPNPSQWAACTERIVKTDKVSAVLVGNVSCVGYFNGNILDVRNWNGNRHYLVGVGASRKLPSA